MYEAISRHGAHINFVGIEQMLGGKASMQRPVVPFIGRIDDVRTNRLFNVILGSVSDSDLTGG